MYHKSEIEIKTEHVFAVPATTRVFKKKDATRSSSVGGIEEYCRKCPKQLQEDFLAYIKAMRAQR